MGVGPSVVSQGLAVPTLFPRRFPDTTSAFPRGRGTLHVRVVSSRGTSPWLRVILGRSFSGGGGLGARDEHLAGL